MKRFSLLILVVIISFSCKKEYTPRNINSVKITEYKQDSISIRAIQVISEKLRFFPSENNLFDSKIGL